MLFNTLQLEIETTMNIIAFMSKYEVFAPVGAINFQGHGLIRSIAYWENINQNNQ